MEPDEKASQSKTIGTGLTAKVKQLTNLQQAAMIQMLHLEYDKVQIKTDKMLGKAPSYTTGDYTYETPWKTPPGGHCEGDAIPETMETPPLTGTSKKPATANADVMASNYAYASPGSASQAHPQIHPQTHPQMVPDHLHYQAYDAVRSRVGTSRYLDAGEAVGLLYRFAQQAIQSVEWRYKQRIQDMELEFSDRMGRLHQAQEAKARMLRRKAKAVPSTGRKFREDEQ